MDGCFDCVEDENFVHLFMETRDPIESAWVEIYITERVSNKKKCVSERYLCR